MLLDKHFDAERVMKTIEEICKVSEFVDPDAWDPSSAWEMERYLYRGKRRLNVVSKQFEQLGYRTITQEFNFRGLVATNALFARGEISDGIILLAAHHDYCAGLGTEDNATGLAIMLELSRCLGEKDSRIMFASFDLEESGLLGSRHFVASPSGQQLRALAGVIVLECLGSGRDVVICQAVVGARSDPVLVSKLQSSARKLGHRVVLESFDWFNSDQVPFAERGIRTVEVCSFNSENYKGGPAPNVNIGHSSLDVPKNIPPSTLQVIGEILLQFVYDY
jgi:hypothetical protein